MIPLHYSVQGNIKKCKKKKRVGAMIPAADFKKKVMNDSIKKIIHYIGQILNGTQQVNINGQMYPQLNNINYVLQHINNFISEINQLFPDKFTNYKKEFNTELGLIIDNNNSTKEEIKQNVDNLIIENKKKITEFIESNSNFRKVLEPLDIRSDPGEKGWSIYFGQPPPPPPPPPLQAFAQLPDNIRPDYASKNPPYYLIMPEKSPKLEIYESKQEIMHNVKTTINDLQESFNKAKDLENKISNNLKDALNHLYGILYCARAINTGQTTVSHYLNLMSGDLEPLPLPPPLPGAPPPNWNNPVGYVYANNSRYNQLVNILRENIEVNVINGPINLPDLPPASKIDKFRIVRKMKKDRDPNDNTLQIHGPEGLGYDTYNQVYRNINIDDYTLLFNTNIGFNLNLSLNPANLNSPNITIPSPYSDQGIANTNNTSGFGTPSGIAPVDPNNNRFNILHILFYAHDRINKCFEIIQKMMTPIENHFVNEYYYELYNSIIPYIVCEIQNIHNLLTFMKNYEIICKQKLNGIILHAKNRITQDGRTPALPFAPPPAPITYNNRGIVVNNVQLLGTKDALSYYHEYIEDYATYCIKQLDDMYKNVNMLNKSLNNLVGSLNKVIELIENIKSIDINNGYRLGFANNFNNFNINNIFNKALPRIKELDPDVKPKKMETIMSNAKNLYDSILLNSTGIIYYGQGGGAADGIPNMHDDDLTDANYVGRNPGNGYPGNGYIFRNKENGLFPNPNPNIEYQIIALPINIEDANTQLLGSLYEHFRQLKYNTIIRILSEIHTIDQDYETNELLKIVDNFIKNIGVSDNKKTEYALIIIGRTIDKVLNNFIKNSINRFSNKYTADLLKQENLDMTQDISNRYQNIYGNNIQVNNIQVTLNEDQQFKLNFKEIFNETIEDFKNLLGTGLNAGNNEIFEKLFKSTVVAKDEDELEDNSSDKLSKFEHYIFSINYHSGNTNFEKMCFDIDPNVIKYLLKKSNINHKDTVGNTPIYYAIHIQHKDIIDMLLKSDAKLVGTINNSNQTPIDYAIQLLQTHNEVLITENDQYDLSKLLYNNLCKTYTDSVIEFIDEKGKFKNNYIPYNETIMPMLIIMYNQYLFSRANSYYKEWTYDDHKKLIKLFNDYDFKISSEYYKKMSFLELDVNEIKDIISSSKNTHVLKYQIKRNKIKKEKYDKDIEMYNNQINNIRKNINEIQDQLYINQLNQKITNLQNKIANLQQKINNMQNNNLETNMNNRITNLSNQFNNLLTTFKNNTIMTRFNKQIYVFYEDVFKEITDIKDEITHFARVLPPNNPLVIGPPNFETKDWNIVTDWRLYIKLWDNYTKQSNKLEKIENIHLIIVLLIKKITVKLKKTSINESNKDTIIKIKDDLNLLNKFYKNICVNTIEDFYTLPQELEENKNYILYEFVGMAKHIIHHTVTRTLFYTIVKLIYQYVKERVDVPDGQDKRNYINKTVKAIIKDNVSGESLIDLLNSNNFEWENKIIKLTLGIYEGDYDQDKSIKNLDDIFNKITNVLLQNKIIPIDEESNLIEYLKNYVYEYYKEAMYTKTIHQMMQLFETYNRYILNESRQIEILEMLLNKVITNM